MFLTYIYLVCSVTVLSDLIFKLNIAYPRYLDSAVTSAYVIDQSMISISVMKKIFKGETKQNPRVSVYQFI